MWQQLFCCSLIAQVTDFTRLKETQLRMRGFHWTTANYTSLYIIVVIIYRVRVFSFKSHWDIVWCEPGKLSGNERLVLPLLHHSAASAVSALQQATPVQWDSWYDGSNNTVGCQCTVNTPLEPEYRHCQQWGTLQYPRKQSWSWLCQI